jgi:hypothetical protein
MASDSSVCEKHNYECLPRAHDFSFCSHTSPCLDEALASPSFHVCGCASPFHACFGSTPCGESTSYCRNHNSRTCFHLHVLLCCFRTSVLLACVCPPTASAPRRLRSAHLRKRALAALLHAHHRLAWLVCVLIHPAGLRHHALHRLTTFAAFAWILPSQPLQRAR